ncbi:unnamed protein product [Effrenium voratum]|nr:unnamed protein product [Effrenium voratum]
MLHLSLLVLSPVKVSPDLKADKGLSAFTLAVLSGECLAALVLLPHCSPANLEEALPGELCWRVGLAGGSTVLHLVAHLGGTRERLLAPLLQRCPALLNRANWAQEIPAMLSPAMMRPTLQPRSLHAFEALGARASEPRSRAAFAAWGEAKVWGKTGIWAWVKIKPQKNPQVIVHVSICRCSNLGTYS